MNQTNQIKEAKEKMNNLLDDLIKEVDSIKSLNEIENKLTIDNFWIELKETSQGLEKLSAQIDGKHYTGFLSQKEGKYSDGNPYFYKTAQMKICQWEKCQLGHPKSFKFLS